MAASVCRELDPRCGTAGPRQPRARRWVVLRRRAPGAAVPTCRLLQLPYSAALLPCAAPTRGAAMSPQPRPPAGLLQQPAPRFSLGSGAAMLEAKRSLEL